MKKRKRQCKKKLKNRFFKFNQLLKYFIFKSKKIAQCRSCNQFYSGISPVIKAPQKMV